MSNGKKKKILIAEDEPAYSRALILKLQNAGFEVESMENGEEALEAIKKGGFDLLLCDLVMPKMNGFQVLEEIKKQGLKTPASGLSNLSQANDEEKMRNAGAIDFLSKANTPIIEVIKRVQGFFDNN